MNNEEDSHQEEEPYQDSHPGEPFQPEKDPCLIITFLVMDNIYSVAFCGSKVIDLLGSEAKTIPRLCLMPTEQMVRAN